MEKTISNARALNKVKGFHWFSPKTMQFFRSQVHGGILKEKYFITSENKGFGDCVGRAFTIREVNWETGNVATVGQFLGYRSMEEAKEAIKQMEG